MNVVGRVHSWLCLVALMLAAFVASGCAASDANEGSPEAARSVSEALTTLVSLAVTPAATSLPANTTQALVATGTYSNKTTKNLTTSATWTSSNPSVATVTAGLVIALAPGSTTITAKSGTISATATITVTTATLTSVTVTPAKRKLAKGSQLQYTATGLFSDGTKRTLTPQVVSWSSSVPAIATITAAGRATAVAIGTSTITATHTASGKTGSTPLTVTAAALASVAVTPSNPHVANGLGQQFVAMGTYTDGSKLDITAQVSWTSSATAVATVSNTAGSNGLATSASPGATTIKATDPVSKKAGSTTLTVTPAVLQSVAVTPLAPSLASGTTLQLTATGTYSDRTAQNVTASVTWTSSSPAVASVSNATGSQGLVTGTSPGTATITATDPTTGATSSVVLTVNAVVLRSIALAPASPSLPLGTTLQLSATGTYSDGTVVDVTQTVTWTSSTGAVLVSNAMGEAGQLLGQAPGTATVTATDPTSHVAASLVVTVTPATLVSIGVTPPAQSIPLGATQAFMAIGVYSDGSTQNLTASATWASSSGAASVSNAAGTSGVATSAAVGATAITATDPATGITGSASLTVSPAALVSLSVTPGLSSIPLGTTQAFAATGLYTDGSTQNLTASSTWASSSGAASISNAAGTNGVATATAMGAATVTATDPTSGIAASAALTVTAAALQSVTVTPTAPSIPLGTQRAFRAIGGYSDGSTQDLTATATWSSSTTSASISNMAPTDGVATATAVGSTTISAVDPSTGISGRATLNVTPAVLVSLVVTPSSATLPLGTNQTFAAAGTFSDGSTHDLTTSVTWLTSNGAIPVSNAAGTNGLATAVATGAATITAVDPTTGVSATAQVTATAAALVSIAVTAPATTQAVGVPEPFVATGAFTDGTTRNISSSVSWSSTNAAANVVPSVCNDAIVTGATAGATTVVATDVATGIQGSLALTVSPAVNGSAVFQFRFLDSNGAALTPTNSSFAYVQVFASNGIGSNVSPDCQGRYTSVVTTGSTQVSAYLQYSSGLAIPNGQIILEAAKLNVTGDTTVDLVFAAVPVTVHVTDPNGIPVANAAVTLNETRGFASCGAAWTSCLVSTVFETRDVNGNSAVTDVDGNVTMLALTGLPASASAAPPSGSTLVQASTPFTATSASTVNLQLVQGDTLTFRFVDANGAALTPANSSFAYVQVFASNGIGSNVSPDAQGRYTSVVTTGSTQVSAYLQYSSGLAIPNGQIILEAAKLNVTGDTTVDLVFAAVPVTVHVTDPNGIPVANAAVTLNETRGFASCGAAWTSCLVSTVFETRDVNGNSAVTDVDGNVTMLALTGLPASASAAPPSGSTLVQASTPFTATSASTVNLQLVQGDTLTFRFVDANGAALTPANSSFAYVQVFASNGIGSNVSPDAQGRYTSVVTTGSTQVSAYLQYSSGLAIPNGQIILEAAKLNVTGDTTVDLVFAAVPVTVHVTDPNGIPVANAAVTLNETRGFASCGAAWTSCLVSTVFETRDVNGNSAVTDVDGNVTMLALPGLAATASAVPPTGSGLASSQAPFAGGATAVTVTLP